MASANDQIREMKTLMDSWLHMQDDVVEGASCEIQWNKELNMPKMYCFAEITTTLTFEQVKEKLEARFICGRTLNIGIAIPRASQAYK